MQRSWVTPVVISVACQGMGVLARRRGAARGGRPAPAQQPPAQRPARQRAPAHRAPWELVNERYWQRQDYMRSCFPNGSHNQRALRALCDNNPQPSKPSFRAYDALLSQERSQVREPKNSKDLEHLEILHWFVITVVTITLKCRRLEHQNTSLRDELAALRERHAPPELRAQEAERRAREAERRAQEAERRTQEAERHQRDGARGWSCRVRPEGSAQRRNAACLRRARVASWRRSRLSRTRSPSSRPSSSRTPSRGKLRAWVGRGRLGAQRGAEAPDQEERTPRWTRSSRTPRSPRVEEKRPTRAPTPRSSKRRRRRKRPTRRPRTPRSSRRRRRRRPTRGGGEPVRVVPRGRRERRGRPARRCAVKTVQVLGVNYALTLPPTANP